MANRVKRQDVCDIIEIEEDKQIAAHIAAANSIVDARLSAAGLTAPQLFEIERWLAAHAIALEIPELGSTVEEQALSARNRLSSAGFGPGLKMTRYGQMAITLDPSGTLEQIAEGSKRASFDVVTSI